MGFIDYGWEKAKTRRDIGKMFGPNYEPTEKEVEEMTRIRVEAYEEISKRTRLTDEDLRRRINI